MNKIDNIITETIHSYINSNVITEKKDSDSGKKDDSGRAFRKKAIKGKGGLRKDFDVKDDKTYNKNVDDMEQSTIEDLLSSGFINRKKVAEKLYPGRPKNSAQSQLNKKLNGDISDSGSKYKLKEKEVKRLRNIIATYLK